MLCVRQKEWHLSSFYQCKRVLKIMIGKYRVIYRYTQDNKVEILIVMEIGRFINRMEVESMTQGFKNWLKCWKCCQRANKNLQASLSSGWCLPGPRFYETDAGRTEALEAAEQRLDSGEYVRDSDINW